MLASTSCGIRGHWSPTECEAKALAFGLRLAIDLNFHHVVVESDYFSLFNSFWSAIFRQNKRSYLLRDCVDLSSQLVSYR